ncbi:MAG: mechanosensitive ion channel family protein [Planctomycetota bacterium]
MRAALQDAAGNLAEALIIAQSTEAEAATSQVEALIAEKVELNQRFELVLDALEMKGVDVAADRLYLAAVETLTLPVPGAEAEPKPATEDKEALQSRVDELIEIVRAEPPAHERPVPWAVSVTEFELELGRLPTDQIIARMDKWQQMLQKQVGDRDRIGRLLNDNTKLESVAEIRAEAEALGVATDDITIEAVKARLAEMSQTQQGIINRIVERMRVGIDLIRDRGGDPSPYTSYIATSTGQTLNFTDPAVLAAQVSAWATSADGGLKVALNFAKFLGVLIAFWILARILGGAVGAAVKRIPRTSSLLRPVLVGITRRVTLFIGIVIAISMLGVNIGPLLAMIGAAGLVIGLALQGTLSNFASGILILINRPYDVGDVITAGGVTGKVEAMNLVSTSILTFDNQLMLVPNNEVWNGVITNITGKKTRRVDMTFGIGYADNMSDAIEIIAEVINEHAKVLKDPAPVIKVHELGDNSVNIIARPWSTTADYWDVFWDITHTVKARFDAEGINIPFPQRDVHIPGPIEIKLAPGSVDAAAVARD